MDDFQIQKSNCSREKIGILGGSMMEIRTSCINDFEGIYM
jgi:hypothetical protein